MKLTEVEIDGKKEKILAQKLRGTLWFHWRGKTYCHVPESKFGSDEAEVGNPLILKAPMPGKVIKLKAEMGLEVKKGEALVVLEAMKMEYTLAAGCDSKVKSILCEVGQQVKLGQVLVELTDLGNGQSGAR